MSSGGSALPQPGDGPGQQDGWSRRFLTRLECAGTAGPRSGKPVADRVSALNVAAGSVTAQVRGSHVRPYDVWVEVPVFRPAQWERTERAMAADPEVCARLREGDVPLRIEELFARVGLPLLPEARELEMECTCPQRVVPCRHILAVLHALADTFDTDPFTVLAWRGRGRARLIQHVEALTASGAPATSPDDPPAVPRARQVTAVPGPAVTDDVSLAACPRTYWLGDHPDSLGSPGGHEPQGADPAIRHLDTPGIVIRRRNLADVLWPLYEVLTSR